MNPISSHSQVDYVGLHFCIFFILLASKYEKTIYLSMDIPEDDDMLMAVQRKLITFINENFIA